MKRWGWKLLKVGLALLILFFVSWQIVRDLTRDDMDYERLEWRPGWLAASAGLYLAGLAGSVWFWRHLLGLFGYPVSPYTALRAHYIGQLGKYVPGKALALAIRATLVHPAGVPYGVSIIASFYETFTTMAAGAFVAALVWAIEPPAVAQDAALRLFDIEWHPLWMGVLLVGMCGLPLLPGVFNFLIARLEARIQAVELYRLPPLRFGALAAGLAANAIGWWVHGLSWWAMLQAVLPEPPALTLSLWAQCTASIAFATVAGFVILVVPGGLGVREYLLSRLLSSVGPVQYITMSAILLRLDWIVAEIVFTLAIYWRKPSNLCDEPTELREHQEKS